MRRLLLLFLLVPSLAKPATAQEAFFGTWGSPAQCAGTSIVPGGTVAAAPIRIGPAWLTQRNTWCQLHWFDPVARADGIFITANASCGEDAARGYLLEMDLTHAAGPESLTLLWDRGVQNGPLWRCAD